MLDEVAQSSDNMVASPPSLGIGAANGAQTASSASSAIAPLPQPKPVADHVPKSTDSSTVIVAAPLAPIEIGSQLAQESSNHLWRRVARECEAMAEHAYSTGLDIPGEVATLIDEALAVFGSNGVQVAPAKRKSTGDRQEPLPVNKTAGTGANSIALLSKAHAALALIIKPATPEAVLLLINERRKRSFWYAFGPLPIVRQMLGLAILSLIALLFISLSREINAENMSKTLLELQGLPLLKVEIFLLSAASLGSCFQNLQQVNAYISSGTYDPKFQSTYWTRWVMGLISGIVLSQIIFKTVLSLYGSGNVETVVPAIVEQPVLA
ncbi:MAG TPA: hypothetical protein VEQ35_08260, partial [Beijerinckia sp.]|nr:hypothetical protein [Beijerinckia sp.]